MPYCLVVQPFATEWDYKGGVSDWGVQVYMGFIRQDSLERLWRGCSVWGKLGDCWPGRGRLRNGVVEGGAGGFWAVER